MLTLPMKACKPAAHSHNSAQLHHIARLSSHLHLGRAAVSPFSPPTPHAGHDTLNAISTTIVHHRPIKRHKVTSGLAASRKGKTALTKH